MGGVFVILMLAVLLYMKSRVGLKPEEYKEEIIQKDSIEV